MSTELHILRDLESGRATAGAIAERIKIHTEVVRIIADRLVAEGKLRTATVAGTLTVYQLVP